MTANGCCDDVGELAREQGEDGHGSSIGGVATAFGERLAHGVAVPSVDVSRQDAERG